MDATVDVLVAAVKDAGASPGSRRRSRSFTFAFAAPALVVLLGLLTLAIPADEATAADRIFGAPTAVPRAGLERQLDRARRDPSGTSLLERRQLQDQLRREPPGPGRTRRENALEQLPPAASPTGPTPLPPPLPTSRLPSSIPPLETGTPTSLPPLPRSRPAIPAPAAP